MQCERLIKMIKSWYISVRDETMAPARMVSFMEQHATTCEVCLQDQSLQEEIAKITELILPESKIPKAIRQQSSLVDDDDSAIENDGLVENGEENDDTLLGDDEEEDVEDIDPEEDEFLEDEED
jgi:hypothetical protein